MNTMQRIVLTVFFGSLSVCSATDLPADSLMIKGLHLGMSRSEFDMAFKKFPDNIRNSSFNTFKFENEKLTTIGFSAQWFDGSEINYVFIEKFIDFYKIPSYFDKTVKLSSFGAENDFAVTHKMLSFEEKNSSYCAFYDAVTILLRCLNKKTGLSVRLYEGYPGRGYIQKIKTLDELKQEEQEADRKKQEVNKNIKFD